MATFSEIRRDALLDEYGGQPFSALLEDYLTLRERGPHDGAKGYTDKDYYARMEVLREFMDKRAPPQ